MYQLQNNVALCLYQLQKTWLQMMFVPFLQTKSLKTNNFDLCLYQLQSFKCFKVLNVCTSFMALRGWCVCGRPKRALRLARAGRRYLYARALVHPEWGRRHLCAPRVGEAPQRGHGATIGRPRRLLWRLAPTSTTPALEKAAAARQLVVRGILQVAS